MLHVLTCALTCAASLLINSTTTLADPIVINFDDKTPGSYGAPYSSLGLALLSTDPSGAVASGFGIGPDPAAVSSPNVAFGIGGVPPQRPFFRGLAGLFLTPNTLDTAFTDFVSFAVVGTQLGQTTPWFVAVSGHGQLLDSASGTTDGLVSFARPSRDIDTFTLSVSNSFERIDDLRFNAPVAPPVPEPATLLLVGSALVPLVVRRRQSWRGVRSEQSLKK